MAERSRPSVFSRQRPVFCCHYYRDFLCGLAVSVVFSEKRVYSVVTGIIAVMLSVIVTAGITDLLIPYGLPALTMPFVVVTWLVLAMRNVLVKM